MEKVARVIIEAVKEGDTEEEIVWSNLKVCDAIQNPALFGFCASAWLRINPAKNYQDLERELRERTFDTHLIAVDNLNQFRLGSVEPHSPDLKDVKNAIYQNGKWVEVEYSCIFSCRPVPFAMEELLTYWPSYDDNFARLPRAGHMFNKKIPNSDKTITFSLTEPAYSLSFNKIKLRIL